MFFLKIAKSDSFRINLTSFLLGREFILKLINFYKILHLSGVNKPFFLARNKITRPWPLPSETETGDFVSPYTGFLLSFRHGFHFQHWFLWVSKCFKIRTTKHWKCKCLIMEDLSIYAIKISPKSWETKLDVIQISVYCRHVFNNVNVCISTKTTALFKCIHIQDKQIVFTVSI